MSQMDKNNKEENNHCPMCLSKGYVSSEVYQTQDVLGLTICPNYKCPNSHNYFTKVDQSMEKALPKGLTSTQQVLDSLPETSKQDPKIKEWRKLRSGPISIRPISNWIQETSTKTETYSNLTNEIIESFKESKQKSEDGYVPVQTNKGITYCQTLDELDTILHTINKLEDTVASIPQGEREIISFPLERRFQPNPEEE